MTTPPSGGEPDGDVAGPAGAGNGSALLMRWERSIWVEIADDRVPPAGP